MKRAFLICLLVLSMTGVVSADLVINVKATSSNIPGADLSENGKFVIIPPGATGLVHFSVYALPGACGANDGLMSLSGSVVTNDDFSGYYPNIIRNTGPYNVTGNLQNGVRDSMWDNLNGTNVNGAQQELTLASTTTGDQTIAGDGMLDLGSNNDASAANFIQLRADTGPTPTYDPPEGGFLIYTFEMNITAANYDNSPTLVDWRPRNQTLCALWIEDGGWKQFEKNGTNYRSAGPVVLNPVPEPSTLILIGMGLLTLPAFRRRKK